MIATSPMTSQVMAITRDSWKAHPPDGDHPHLWIMRMAQTRPSHASVEYSFQRVMIPLDPSPLFEPFAIKRITLPNRFVMPGMQRMWCDNGTPLRCLADY